MALETSPENPAPLSRISTAIGNWVARLGAVWVEGQVTQINRRSGNSQAYVGVRDIEENISIQVVTSPGVLDAISPPLQEGDRIVMHAKPEYWTQRGQLVLRARTMTKVGLGDLLARVELLKTTLAAEGLFREDRKRPLPFLPRRVGLICGRESAAEHDVVENASRRWPAVDFEIREVVVQGDSAARAVTRALQELQGIAGIDVIVITRGGGSAEDLLPFSDEALIRAVAACPIPIVSAIGHEQDAPLLDYAADYRASTPTDAAARIVPDLGEQHEMVSALRQRSTRALLMRLDRESDRVARWAAHPGLADPSQNLDRYAREIGDQRHRYTRALAHKLQSATDQLGHLNAQLRQISPQATLSRGYAIVTTEDDRVVRDPSEVEDGELLEVRVDAGSFGVITVGSE